MEQYQSTHESDQSIIGGIQCQWQGLRRHDAPLTLHLPMIRGSQAEQGIVLLRPPLIYLIQHAVE